MDFDYKRDFERMLQYCRETGDVIWLSTLVPSFEISARTSSVCAINASQLVETVRVWSDLHPYKPEIDWMKVPSETMVEVSYDGSCWVNRRFSAYTPCGEKGIFWCIPREEGFSASNEPFPWQHCRLVEDNPAYHKDV